MSYAEDQVWENFFKGVTAARPSLDGHVPIGVILAPVDNAGTETADITVDDRAISVWHESISQEAIGAILKILTEQFESKQVRRH